MADRGIYPHQMVAAARLIVALTSLVACARSNPALSTSAPGSELPADPGGRPDGGSAGRPGAHASERAVASSGCGVPATPATGWFPQVEIDVGGVRRTYAFLVPDDYTFARQYMLVFGYHGACGTGPDAAALFYEPQPSSPQRAIFVYPDGQGAPCSGWNPGLTGNDVRMFDLVLDRVKRAYCIDETKVFAAGISFGGSMANSLGCYRGDKVRAVANGLGCNLFTSDFFCRGQVAAWEASGNLDSSFACGKRARDFALARNHCGVTAVGVDPPPCVGYSACDPDKPVTWCEFDGGHEWPSFASEAIWNFFASFP